MAAKRIFQRWPSNIRCSNGLDCKRSLRTKEILFKQISTNAVLSRSEKGSSRSGLLQWFFRPNTKTRQETRGALAPVPMTQAEEQLHIQRKVWEEVVGEDKVTTEKFIPITRQMLVKTLVKESAMLSPQERDKLEDFSAALDAYTSQRFYTRLEDMKHLYDLLDPDKDTIQVRQVTRKELIDDEYWLLQKLESLLYKANYFKIPRDQTLFLIKEHEAGEGVSVVVDPLDYSVLRMWTRGRSPRKYTLLQKLKQSATSLLSRASSPSNNDLYTRVFVAVRSKKENKLHLKVFKDIPCDKLEYLLPDGKIMMSKFDKGFLASSAFLGTFAIGVKLYSLALDWKIDFGLLGLTIAALIGVKGWAGYKNKRNKYLLNVSRTLYYNTVSNNRGVLTLLTDRALDEEFKETLLAYVFLLSPANRRGVPGTAHTADKPEYDSASSLQSRVEKWLLETFKIDKLHFDVDDALLKLDNMGLLVRHADDTYSALPIDVALNILPTPTSRWESLGILRDSESPEDGKVREADSYTDHGWK